MTTSLPVMRVAFACAIALLYFGRATSTADEADPRVDPAVLAAEAQRVAVVQEASRATLAIFAKGGQGGGSGVVISPDGYAVSNFHVTNEAGASMKCGMADGRLYDAVIVGIDPTGDVALIKLLGREDFPAAELADSDQVRVGDWCFTIGNPFLLATDFQPSVAYGVISGTHRYQYPAGTILEYTDCLQADAAINPGNSGGPMFDARGRLIGINGRGSFEKRGRVNVGVGYAISINQVKNFLGHLKSGRVVDHATLGASVRSDDRRRVVVDDILDESDVFRRGLRYGDELTSFGGRNLSTVNAFKNVLGIYPKGWRVPMSFRHRGESFDVMVRLRGVHSETELADMLEGKKKVQRPDDPKHEDPKPDQPKQEGPKQGQPSPGEPETPKRPRVPDLPGHAAPHAEPMSEIVKAHYDRREGYVNFYFNRLHRDRVWRAFVARGDFAAADGIWTLSGVAAGGEAVSLEIGSAQSAIRLPSGELRVDVSGDLSARLEPPASGGLLAALSLWRRLLVLGPDKFGDVTYWGTAPIAGHDRLLDVLAAGYRDVECRCYFDSADGQLAVLEMFPEEEADPCELYFSEYREVDGRQLPSRIEVRHGDGVYQIYDLKEAQLKSAELKGAEEKRE